jgi:aryl-alcohol dehydrogenase-like predicted oxidoreductase
MKLRKLGKSGIEISVLGMGCWQYGGGSYWGPQAQSDVDAVVSEALDAGINFFDTAEVYNDGDSEKSLGQALKGRRDKAIVGTKISPDNTAPAILREHCEASLRRLQTDYIDLYMIHWPITPRGIAHYSQDQQLLSSPPSLDDAYETLTRLREEGKIRTIGISNHGVKQMSTALEKGLPFDANELAYSLVSRAIEDSILPFCADHQVGILGYSSLQQGVLAGKYRTVEEVKPMLARTRHFHHSRGAGSRHGEEGAEAELFQALHGIREVADGLGVDMAVLSLAWAIANEAITSTLVGCRNSEQLAMNIKGAQLELSADVVAKLNAITDPLKRKLGPSQDYYENTHKSRTE